MGQIELPRNRYRGFTLVELLVVIGIIAVLIAILFPTLARAREQARRVVCASRLKQLAAANHMYANENKGNLCPGSRDAGDTDEHCIWISHEMYDVFTSYVGSNLLFACPNLEDQLPSESTIGWVIGYDYLAGHPKVMAARDWTSPLKATDSGSLPMWCDLDDWSPATGGRSSATAPRISRARSSMTMARRPPPSAPKGAMSPMSMAPSRLFPSRR